MTTNERIALAQGWKTEEMDLREKHGAMAADFYQENRGIRHLDSTHWLNPSGQPSTLPDYEHSLNALLEPLGVLEGKGWTWNVNSSGFGNYRALVTRVEPFKAIRYNEASPSEALALAVAEALEASK